MKDPLNFRLDEKIVVITGASEGIGAGISEDLAASGATVVLCARNVDRLATIKKKIESTNGEAHCFALDVSSVEDIRKVFGDIHDQFGRIDVLVNNAGLGFNHPALEVTEEDWDSMMDVNLKGLFFCAQQAGRYMLQQGTGRIINMSSQASLVAIQDHAVYCASKGGVNSLTQVLALEWADKGITVNGLAPTFTYTPGTAERLDDPQYLEGVLKRIPVGKVATIQDISAAILYLSSPHAGMVTGTTLTIDGGWTIQ